jgi:hypothetical protein
MSGVPIERPVRRRHPAVTLLAASPRPALDVAPPRTRRRDPDEKPDARVEEEESTRASGGLTP